MNKICWSLIISTSIGPGCRSDKEIEVQDKASVYTPAAPSYAYITQGFSGYATVVPDISYEGVETLSIGVNDLPDSEYLQTELVWNIIGTPTETPEACVDCVFSFDLDLTFDTLSSTDPNNSGSDLKMALAFGRSSYGENTLFYGIDEYDWHPWLVHGSSQLDLADTVHTQLVTFDGIDFTYSDGIVDFYYYY